MYAQSRGVLYSSIRNCINFNYRVNISFKRLLHHYTSSATLLFVSFIDINTGHRPPGAGIASSYVLLSRIKILLSRIRSVVRYLNLLFVQGTDGIETLTMHEVSIHTGIPLVYLHFVPDLCTHLSNFFVQTCIMDSCNYKDLYCIKMHHFVSTKHVHSHYRNIPSTLKL